MWLCLVLFCGRVIGQVFVGIYAPAWLPPWREWYSGVLPYPALFPVQITLIMGMSVVAAGAVRGRGKLGRIGRRRLAAAGWAYVAAMLARYVLAMSLHPERRWLGGTIPIVFHLVLAGFVLLWARAGGNSAATGRRIPGG